MIRVTRIGELGTTLAVISKTAFVIIFRVSNSVCFRGSAVGTEIGYRLDDRGPGMVKNYHFSIASRPAPTPIQPPIHWVPGALSQGDKTAGV
jgi:hypothetical protein